MSSHQPKSGGLKQVNKTHKAKFRTKGSIAGEHKGRVAALKTTVGSAADHRQQRRNTASQLRKARRTENALERTRSTAPFLIALVDLCHEDGAGANAVFQHIAAIGTTAGAQPPYATVYIPRVKRHVTLAVPPRDVLSTLELTKAADLVLFVMSAASPVDAIGSSLVTCLYMQGVPTVAHVILGLEQLSAKRRGDRKKQLVHEAEAAPT